ncbi:3-oxoacyl-ACP reductase (plasmid) [Mycolicibacterium madagascariense]|uniref:3-oxoacyl-ACP reductase n=1 Tax=Mycolicibacterium madagascariense TaxID=212765 RepID=A0A7I7XPR6_9MYCO|nr:SDR family oxidoreductase [Mycolicibacterium madagascariense]BBZ31229.1 3-oxoacyl-ACP reductase [Mycolicibacterium madagascariense]
MPTEPDANVVPDYAALMRLDGQVHVVLGAGQGIGYQSAHALSAFGATVVCVDRDGDRAEQVAAEVGGRALVGEITDRESTAQMFAHVEQDFGRLDGVADIVGLARYKPLVDLTDDDWTFHFDIVLKHAYLALEAAARVWERTKTGGAIAFVASVAGLQSSPNLAAYGAMKAALMSLVRTSAVELGPLGVRVNAVAPGTVRTPRAQANPKWTQELLDANVKKTPTGRLSYPADVASALLFLLSPLSAQITGTSLVVDGGNMVLFNVDTPTP